VRQIKALPADRMPIGELSRLCGVHIETIRYYEKIGMLPAPPRTESGRRVYGPKETRILVFIRRGRELGFTLDQIRALLTLGGPGKASCAEVREIAEHHIEDISAKIDDLTRLKRLLRDGRAMLWREGTRLPRAGYSRCPRPHDTPHIAPFGRKRGCAKIKKSAHKRAR
jgi:MerR family transcriptional regulator, mercuric resistance operon regulatory protein